MRIIEWPLSRRPWKSAPPRLRSDHEDARAVFIAVAGVASAAELSARRRRDPGFRIPCRRMRRGVRETAGAPPGQVPGEIEATAHGRRRSIRAQRRMSAGTAGLPPEETAELTNQLSRRLMEVDAQHIQELKPLLDRYGWFTIREFDAIADRNAWLLVQHADSDPALQRRVLKLLEPLTKTADTSLKTSPSLRRVAVSRRTRAARVAALRQAGPGHGTCPGSLIRRGAGRSGAPARVGLEPLAEYRGGQDLSGHSVGSTRLVRSRVMTASIADRKHREDDSSRRPSSCSGWASRSEC